MEEEEVMKGSSSSSSSSSTTSSSSSFRWSPTKEQVAILEGMYREGVRTPSAEQIQEIARRLRAFGGIQGKNVFYWFQNHKARQRQMTKHDDRAVRRRHHRPPPPPLSAAPFIYPPQSAARPNVVYAPCGIPIVEQAGATPMTPTCFYYRPPTDPNVYFPGAVGMVAPKQESNLQSYCGGATGNSSVAAAPRDETLQLFPLRPASGSLPFQEERSGSTSLTSAASVAEEEGGGGSTTESIPFFNFFGPNSQGN